MGAFSRNSLSGSKLIVIKVGSSSLVDSSGRLTSANFKKIASEISVLSKKLGKKIVLVTSGAIAAGKDKLGSKALSTIQEKQAAAAIGQGLLMKEYEQSFLEHGILIGQVLLTRDALEHRRRYINARNTIDQILSFGAVPIINENDTVSVDEIKFGDNDTMSALVANLMGADLLIMLSDVEGFIKDGRILSVVDKINKDIELAAGGSTSRYGTGGMVTKISAAKTALAAGIPAVIAGFKETDVLSKIVGGEDIGTVFVPKPSKIEGKKRWLMSGKKPSGKVAVDDGARKALIEHGKSLLPVGIKDVKGRFFRGDVVSITDSSSHEIARGITNYDSEEISKIKGKNSSDAENALGALHSDEVIHRNNMVII